MGRNNIVYADFPNTGIDPERWHVNEHRYDLLEISLLAIGAFTGIGSIFILFNVFDLQESFFSNALAFALFIGCIVATAYFGSKWIKSLRRNYQNRVEAYRMEKLPVFVEGLAKSGLTISKGSINTMGWNNRPALVDSEGNIYWTMGISMNSSSICISATLEEVSEETVKSEAEELLEDYEKGNRTLSAEERELFMEAVKLGFDYADSKRR